MKNKIQNLQALRGFAALFVVAFHLLPIEKKYGDGLRIVPDFFEFGMFGVDLFFVISGFVMVVITRNEFQQTRKSFIFLYHRAARIYPLYWLYSLLVLAVFIVRPTWVNSADGNQIDILASFLLIPAHTLPLINVGWTLIHELYFYLVFFVLVLSIAERHLAPALCIWGTVVAILNIGVETSDPVLNLVSHPLTIEFIGGCFLAKIFYEDIAVSPGLLVGTAFLVFALSLLGYSLYENSSGAPSGWWRIALYGVLACVVVYGMTQLERHGYIMHSFLVKLGDASYSIYLSHVLVLSAAGRIWSAISGPDSPGNIIMIPVLCVLVISFGMLSYRFVEKPLIRLSRRIA